MEKLARKIADSVGESQGLDAERTAVVSYGLAALFQMIIIFAVVSIIGAVAGFWFETATLFLAVGLLRKATGGAHSSYYAGCLCASIGSICLLGAGSRYLILPHMNYAVMAVTTAVYILCFIIILKRAPVDSPNKPIRKEEKIRRLRKNAVITIIIYFLLTAGFYLLSFKNFRFMTVGVSLTAGALWQSLMLTDIGKGLTGIIDRAFAVIVKN